VIGDVITRIPAVGPANPNSLSAGGVKHGSVIYTTQIPRREDGSFELGDISLQAEQTLRNLETALTRFGSSLADLLHLTIYLTDIEDRHGFNDVYARLVPSPYPARCAVEVAALAVPGIKVEITAVAAA